MDMEELARSPLERDHLQHHAVLSVRRQKLRGEDRSRTLWCSSAILREHSRD